VNRVSIPSEDSPQELGSLIETFRRLQAQRAPLPQLASLILQLSLGDLQRLETGTLIVQDPMRILALLNNLFSAAYGTSLRVDMAINLSVQPVSGWRVRELLRELTSLSLAAATSGLRARCLFITDDWLTLAMSPGHLAFAKQMANSGVGVRVIERSDMNSIDGGVDSDAVLFSRGGRALSAISIDNLSAATGLPRLTVTTEEPIRSSRAQTFRRLWEGGSCRDFVRI
jgi:hypothetical protein